MELDMRIPFFVCSLIYLYLKYIYGNTFVFILKPPTFYSRHRLPAPSFALSPFPCDTSKIIGREVLSLPHLQEKAGVPANMSGCGPHPNAGKSTPVPIANPALPKEV